MEPPDKTGVALLSRLTHDLGQPLTGAQFVLERALSKELSPGGYRESLGAALQEVGRAITILNQASAIAAAQREANESPELLDVLQVTRTCLGEVEQMFDSAGVAVSLRDAGPTLVYANRNWLHQALGSLLIFVAEVANLRHLTIGASPSGGATFELQFASEQQASSATQLLQHKIHRISALGFTRCVLEAQSGGLSVEGCGKTVAILAALPHS